jgi:hypothetical protein
LGLLVILSSAVLLALAGALVRLFGVVHIYLSEFILLTVAAGAPTALLVSRLLSRSPDALAFLLLWGIALHALLGAAGSGLWVAQRLSITDSWKRIGLVGLFLAAPFLVFGTLASVVFAVCLPAPALPLLVGILAWSAVSFCRLYLKDARQVPSPGTRTGPGCRCAPAPRG